MFVRKTTYGGERLEGRELLQYLNYTDWSGDCFPSKILWADKLHTSFVNVRFIFC